MSLFLYLISLTNTINRELYRIHGANTLWSFHEFFVPILSHYVISCTILLRSAFQFLVVAWNRIRFSCSVWRASVKVSIFPDRPDCKLYSRRSGQPSFYGSRLRYCNRGPNRCPRSLCWNRFSQSLDCIDLMTTGMAVILASPSGE